MRFAHAGWCQACLAEDLLYAKAIEGGSIFYICAACTAAGRQPPTADASPGDQSITKHLDTLAPGGWTLALSSELEDSQRQVEKEADQSYEQLIAWFPGFHFRSVK